MNGTVFLVGGGPGDATLVTERARELLRAAEVVVFDRLAPRQLLELVSRDCELIDAGKTAGDHRMGQDEINALLVRAALAGKVVVRLKGGDPYLFGRGGEEAAYCVTNRVPFEVVPGITSALAVPAYAGIPVTHRGLAHHVTLVTASAGRDGHGDPDYGWLAASNGTLVFLMGLRRVQHVVSNLIAGGAPLNRPAAVISRGTTARQRTATGTLSDIADRVAEAELASPAIIVVGEVVSLRDTLDWFERRPLFGVTVAVTRARSQSSELATMLRGLGADVVECPTIRMEPLDPDALQAAMAVAGSERDFLVLTSRTGAQLAFAALRRAGRDARDLSGVRVAAVGAGTAEVCAANGIRPDIVPPVGRRNALGLLEVLTSEPLWGSKVLVVRALEGDDRLLEGLRDGGADVELLAAYRNVVDQPDELTLAAALAADAVTFTAASTVRNFVGLVPTGVALPPAVSIGPRTTAAATSAGFRVVAEATEPSVAGLVVALLGYTEGAHGAAAAGTGHTQLTQ